MANNTFEILILQPNLYSLFAIHYYFGFLILTQKSSIIIDSSVCGR